MGEGGYGGRRTNGRANYVDETGLKRKTRWKKKKLETQLWVRAPSAAAAVAAQLQPLLIVSFARCVCCNCKGNRRHLGWAAVGLGLGRRLWFFHLLDCLSVGVCVCVCACGLAWLLRQLEKHVET